MTKGELKKLFLLRVVDEEKQEFELLPVTARGDDYVDQEDEEYGTGFVITASNYGHAHVIATNIPFEKIPLDECIIYQP